MKLEFIRTLDGVVIEKKGSIELVLNIGQSGASAYQSYLATTTDDPKLSEANWVISLIGENGSDGRGIISVIKTDTQELTDTYTITYSDNTTSTFDVVNGYNGADGKTAYQSAVEGGYVGTEADFNNDLALVSDKQDKTDNSLATVDKTVVGAINEVNSIAKGANQALSFDDYQAVIAAMLVSGLNSGQNLYVDTLDVPDLWVKVVELTSVPYAYVSDEQFIADILAGTQIGYYRLALLETQKVDLTNYYTKSETDQAISDYAEPLRTTDQNYVSDAELEVLQDTSGVNTGDETQDSLGEKIELTELETVTDNTKIAASDSAFLKWFSGATLKTFLSLTYAKIVDYFSKTESDRRFVNQNGGTIYHITRWFTPTSALTIAANGLSATITSGQFTSAMTGAKLKLTGGVNEPIITYVNSNTINLSFAVDSAFWGRNDIAVADWGVYSRSLQTSGLYTIIYSTDGKQTMKIGANFDINGALYSVNDWYNIGQFIVLNSNSSLVWGSSTTGSTKDLGIRRISDGLMEIYNGVTNGVLRDLKLRSLYADKIIPNSDTTGVVFYKADGTTIMQTSKLLSLTDSNEAIGAGSYIDLESGRSGRGSIVFGDGVGYAYFIFTSAGVVTLIQYTSNVFTSVQTGTNHVIIKDNGTNVRIVNEMGATLNFNVKIQYN